MGNINSQVSPVTIQKYTIEPSSRTKVLPIGTATAILRPTENGEILQAGGTLTKTKRASYEKFYSSEPDLKLNTRPEKKVIVNSKPKKYKAPPRPVEREFRTKRLGLYKTRMESRMNTTTPKVSMDEDKVVPQTVNDEVDDEILETSAQKSEMKKFYFGMNEVQSYPSWITPDSSDSEETNYHTENEKISLRLRPHLPKKRLEIPRFSPGSAWKLLRVDTASTRNDDNTPEATIHEDDSEIGFLEAKIKEPSILRSDIAYFQDKSGDSGISGDDSPKTFNRYGNEKSWTPQQDLGNDSSIDDETTSTPSFSFPHRPHIFSLSLPRDRDLKRSVSGPFSTELRVPELFETYPFPNSNWVLSKSAPNSLNGFTSLEENDGRHSRGRIMYLPGGSNDFEVPKSTKKPDQKKFSFQNTIRQIERRKLAEKLGKEVEIKERQRLEEIEAMRRIEEEFRKKRRAPR